MADTVSSPIYDELVDLLSEDVVPSRILSFQLSPSRQMKLDGLLDKNRAGTLSSEEAEELDAFAHFEHVVRMLKARALQAKRP